jgi:glutathione S-transferase
MGLTFYYAPQSSASPVHWTILELGVPCEKVVVDLKQKHQKRPEYLALDPNGRVPVLVHDGVAIFESVAIQLYLGEMFGVEKGLYPAPGPARGEVMRWIVWTNVTVGEALSRYGRNMGMWGLPEDEVNAKAGATAKEELQGLVGIIDRALEGRDYLTGGAFSLADLHVSSWMDYVRMMGIDLAPFSNVAGWVSRCTSRPTYALAE